MIELWSDQCSHLSNSGKDYTHTTQSLKRKSLLGLVSAADLSKSLYFGRHCGSHHVVTKI